MNDNAIQNVRPAGRRFFIVVLKEKHYFYNAKYFRYKKKIKTVINMKIKLKFAFKIIQWYDFAYFLLQES